MELILLLIGLPMLLFAFLWEAVKSLLSFLWKRSKELSETTRAERRRCKLEAEKKRRAQEAYVAHMREVYGEDLFDLSEEERQERIRTVDEARERNRRQAEEALRRQAAECAEQERREREKLENARQEQQERERLKREYQERITQKAAQTKARIERENRERAEDREKSARPLCYPNGCSTCSRDCPFDL